MNAQIKSFKMEDIADVIKCWNNNLPYDLINEQRFIDSILLDDNFDSELFKVAKINEKVIGFGFGIKRKIPYLERGLEEDRGWINMLAVDLEYQHQGIGTKILKELEAELINKGTKEITLCAYSPNYFTPGIDIRYDKAIKFFEKYNYLYSNNSVSMQRDLWDYSISKETIEKRNQLAKEGIRILRYEKKYMLVLLDFLSKEFGSGWKRNALMAMQRHEAEDTILLCVNQKDQILGFCMRKIDGNEGRFGPFGVHESLRSKGLGSILFETMMYEMKARQIPYLYFLWTGGAAQRFYERHQVNVYREYRLYRKVVAS